MNPLEGEVDCDEYVMIGDAFVDDCDGSKDGDGDNDFSSDLTNDASLQDHVVVATDETKDENMFGEKVKQDESSLPMTSMTVSQTASLKPFFCGEQKDAGSPPSPSPPSSISRPPSRFPSALSLEEESDISHAFDLQRQENIAKINKAALPPAAGSGNPIALYSSLPNNNQIVEKEDEGQLIKIENSCSRKVLIEPPPPPPPPLPALSQEERDLRYAVVLQRQENLEALQAASTNRSRTNQHQAQLAAQRNRTARSEAFTKLAAIRAQDKGKPFSDDGDDHKDDARCVPVVHGDCGMTDYHLLDNEAKDNVDVDDYIARHCSNNNDNSSGSNSSKGIGEENLQRQERADYELAVEWQQWERMRAGTAKTLQSIQTKDETHRSSHQRRTGRSTYHINQKRENLRLPSIQIWNNGSKVATVAGGPASATKLLD